MNLNNELAENLRRINELERENTTLKLKMDEIQHITKKDMANFKLEMAKEKGAHNRALEVLNNEIEGEIGIVELREKILFHLSNTHK